MNILISGASGDIGRAITLYFAGNGHNIAACSKSDENGLFLLKNEIDRLGKKCFVSLCDVSDENQVSEFISSSANALGNIDILVNNAGISYIGLLQDMSLREWNHVINTNLTSAFLMSKYLIPQMLKKQSGHIINISSIWGNIGASMEAAYSASKGGLNAFTKALAKELAPSNISVNAIAAGFIDTKMNNGFNEEELNSILDKIPMGRAGKPDEVAELVYKISTSTYLTGQIVTLDGGWT